MAWLDDRLLSCGWAGVGVLLVIGTILSLLFHHRRPSPETRKTLLRVRTWWIIAACLFAAMATGPLGVAALFCLVSVLSAWEFVKLDPNMSRPKLVGGILALGSVSVSVLALASMKTPSWGLWVGLLPIMAFALATATGSVRRTLLCLFAFLLGGCGLACVPALARIGSDVVAPLLGLRLVFLLLLLTGLNDIAQYLWGKGLGRRPIVPRLSPAKTWAGFIGGVLTTVFLAAILVPLFTARHWGWGIWAGLAVGIGGFAGDIIASAYKRSVGACESGTLLPGHGGIIDRIDSLCVTAPLLYCLVRFG